MSVIITLGDHTVDLEIQKVMQWPIAYYDLKLSSGTLPVGDSNIPLLTRKELEDLHTYIGDILKK